MKENIKTNDTPPECKGMLRFKYLKQASTETDMHIHNIIDNILWLGGDIRLIKTDEVKEFFLDKFPGANMDKVPLKIDWFRIDDSLNKEMATLEAPRIIISPSFSIWARDANVNIYDDPYLVAVAKHRIDEKIQRNKDNHFYNKQRMRIIKALIKKRGMTSIEAAEAADYLQVGSDIDNTAFAIEFEGTTLYYQRNNERSTWST